MFDTQWVLEYNYINNKGNDKMKTKETLKPRGVRFGDSQWGRLEKRAIKEDKTNKDARVTTSDIVRQAVDEMEARERQCEAI